MLEIQFSPVNINEHQHHVATNFENIMKYSRAQMLQANDKRHTRKPIIIITGKLTIPNHFIPLSCQHLLENVQKVHRTENGGVPINSSLSLLSWMTPFICLSVLSLSACCFSSVCTAPFHFPAATSSEKQRQKRLMPHNYG